MLLGARNAIGGGSKNPWSGLNCMTVEITDDYKTFKFPQRKQLDGVITAALILSSGHQTFSIDWGDGTKDVYDNTSKKGGVSHTYSVNGRYNIVMSNDISCFSVYGRYPENVSNNVVRVNNLADNITMEPFFMGGDTDGFNFFFANCKNLEYFDASESSIEFLGGIFGAPGRGDGLCDKLEDVRLPKTLLITGDRFLYSLGAWNAGGLDLPEGFYQVSNNNSMYNNFRDTKFEYVHFPSTLTQIYGQYHFYGMSYPIVIDALTPPTVYNSNAFASFRGVVYVPDESVEAYKTADIWSSLASKIKPKSEMSFAVN